VAPVDVGTRLDVAASRNQAGLNATDTMTDEDDKLNELRDILRGTKAATVVPLRPRTIAAARDSLPGGLRRHFDDLVADCHAAAFETGPGALPDYRMLADLVRGGWRRSGGTPTT
jgi:hypothetical protein